MINLEEILRLHNFQIRKVELVNIKAFKEGEVSPTTHRIHTELKISHAYPVKSIVKPRKNKFPNEAFGTATLQVHMTSAYLKDPTKKRRKPSKFEITVELQAVCSTPSTDLHENFKFFLEYQAIGLLWPYARQVVAETMIQMNLIPFVLPTLDLTQYIADIIAKKRQSNTQKNE